MKHTPEDLKTYLGQCFWIGLNGTAANDPSTEEIFRSFQPGGAILFQRNVVSAAQVRKMNTDLQSRSNIPLFIAIDQEGGSVERLHECIGTIPPAMALSAARDKALLRKLHSAHARVLRTLGFNVNFTPVLDLALSSADNGLGTRCYSNDPAVVVEYAREVARAHASEGILVCGKHFPGLGDTDLDSHLDLPTVPRSWSKLERDDLFPYRKMLNDLPFIMVNHAVYPEKNPRFPASLAPEIVSGYLLNDLRYNGLAISDDLNMGAISNLYNLSESAERALLAGNHLFLICRPEGVVRAYRRLLELACENPRLRQLIEQSAARILAYKFRALRSSLPVTDLRAEMRTLASCSLEIARKSITLLQGKPGSLERECTLFLPETKWLRNRKKTPLRDALSKRGCRVTERFYPVKLGEGDAVTLASQSATHWNIVITTSMSANHGQSELVQRLLKAGRRVTLLNGFFPLDPVPEQVDCAIASYWTSVPALQASSDVLLGKSKPFGRLPLTTVRRNI